VDEEFLLVLGEGPAERALGEPAAERAKLGLAVLRVVGGSRELAQMGGDIARDFNRRVGGCLVPRLRDRRAALVARAPVIGGERGLEYERFRSLLGREVVRGDDLAGPLRQ